MLGPSRESRLLNPDFRDILSAFCEEKVEFMLVGAYAVAAHGLSRATGDIDLWVKCSEKNVERVWAAIMNLGAHLAIISKQYFRTRCNGVQHGVTRRRTA